MDGVQRAIDRLASHVRGSDDGRTRGMPRRIVLDAGAVNPRVVFGARNIEVQLRVAGALVSSAEYVVGPIGIATGRALRTAATDAAGMTLCRAVVRHALLGAPLGGASLRERLGRVRPEGAS